MAITKIDENTVEITKTVKRRESKERITMMIEKKEQELSRLRQALEVFD